MTINEIRNKAEEKVEDNFDVSQILQWIDRWQKVVPNKPTEPCVAESLTESELGDYENNMLNYRLAMERWNQLTTEAKKFGAELEIIKETTIKEVSGFYTHVPTQYQDRVYSLAYQQGHSAGHYEVYLKLCELVYVFKI